MAQLPRVAYFSMEIGLESGMPTYSGGLGVLAGDTIRSAADLEVPMVAVSLLHRRGYFFQRLLAEKHSALVRGAKLLLEKEVMSGADLKDTMAAH